MAVLAPQQFTIAGIAPTYQAVNASDSFTPDEDLILHVKNGSASAVTVTLTDAGRTPGGSTATNPTVSVPAGTDRFIGPFPPAYANPATGFIAVSYSATATVTAALLKS